MTTATGQNQTVPPSTPTAVAVGTASSQTTTSMSAAGSALATIPARSVARSNSRASTAEAVSAAASLTGSTSGCSAATLPGTLLVLDARSGYGPSADGPNEAILVGVRGGTVAAVLATGLPWPADGGIAAATHGGMVAYAVDRDSSPGMHQDRAGLWLVGGDGKGGHRLLAPPSSPNGNQVAIGPVAWSPDGAQLAYAVNLAGGAANLTKPETALGVWLTPAARPRPRQLAAPRALGTIQLPTPTTGDSAGSLPYPSRIAQLSWSADGATLAVSTWRQDPSGQSAPVALAVTVATGHVDLLVQGAQEAVYSPDGVHLAYVLGQPGPPSSMALHVADRAGGHARRLVAAPAGSGIASPAWSADSQFLAYIGNPANGEAMNTAHALAVSGGPGCAVLGSGNAKQPFLLQGGRFARLARMTTQ